MTNTQQPTIPAEDGEIREHNELDRLMTAALMREHSEWDMEIVREASLICSNALLREPNVAFMQRDTEVSRLLDKYGRDIAVSGLHNHGFSTSAQKILKKLQAALKAREQRIALESRIDELERSTGYTTTGDKATRQYIHKRLADLTAQLTQLPADTNQSERSVEDE